MKTPNNLKKPWEVEGIEWREVRLGKFLEIVYRYPNFYGFTYVDNGIPILRGEELAQNFLKFFLLYLALPLMGHVAKNVKKYLKNCKPSLNVFLIFQRRSCDKRPFTSSAYLP